MDCGHISSGTGRWATTGMAVHLFSRGDAAAAPFGATGRLLAFGEDALGGFDAAVMPESAQLFVVPMWTHWARVGGQQLRRCMPAECRKYSLPRTELSPYAEALFERPDADFACSLYMMRDTLQMGGMGKPNPQAILAILAVFDEDAASALFATEFGKAAPVPLRHAFSRQPISLVVPLKSTQRMDTTVFPPHAVIHDRLFVITHSGVTPCGRMLRELPSADRVSLSADGGDRTAELIFSVPMLLQQLMVLADGDVVKDALARKDPVIRVTCVTIDYDPKSAAEREEVAEVTRAEAAKFIKDETAARGVRDATAAAAAAAAGPGSATVDEDFVRK